MWYNTKISQLLGIDYPILQGPFGGNLSTVELAAAVSNAGGLGGFGAYTLNPQEIVDVNNKIKSATAKPYNLNLWVSDTDMPDDGIFDLQYERTKEIFGSYFDALDIDFPTKPAAFQSRFENQLDVILDIRPKVFSFIFGSLPVNVIEECRSKGIITIGTATTLDEAIVLENSGVDAIIASGFEAGGHRPSFLAKAESSLMGTFTLLQLIREKVNIPVIAAGGIADAKGITAALILGADAVQIGTAFLACEESGAIPIHRDMLFSEEAKYTTLTRAFTGRLGRGIGSLITKQLPDQEITTLPFPLQTSIMSSLRKAALEQQRPEFLFLWSGQIAPILKHRNASELMRSLIRETTEQLDLFKK
ncbi:MULTISPECIES: NAD(P)H-dependent flavin oxidoreductase [unclassified Sphingobacterium]|uniref:NAD(P)H-dependent flavin oxidoreductase n=1 Tax=unclassified Sphingobacterium TaxID=2609468 RepID=UPI0025DC7480|nr:MULTISPECIES: nitronate monooxygenase [unclassified Sphingobacterium]